MADEKCADQSQPEPNKGKIPGSSGAVAASKLPSASDADPSAIGESQPSNKLTPEEQMALFEKDLKENDWGHQPC